MPALPDVGPLGSLAGWAVAVLMVAGVLTLIVLGKLVPGVTHDRAVSRGDKLDETVSTLANEVRSQNVLLRDISEALAILVDRGKR